MICMKSTVSMFSTKRSEAITLFLLLTFSAVITALPKPFNLTVLHLVPMTESGPRNGQTCKTAAQIVADIVNNRTDILPDYHIEMQYDDEAAGAKVPKDVVNFAQAELTYSFKSPIIVGPNYSPGCQSAGMFLQYLNLIDISGYCAAPVLTNRKLYPNLYLMISTGTVTAIAEIQFIKFVGQWKRIGLLSNAANMNDYTTAEMILKVATENGIQVPFFDIVLDVTGETIGQLKAHDLRVIAIYTNGGFMIEHLLCEGYKAGMTGPRYVFIINMSVYNDPSTSYPKEVIYPGCTRSIIVEQMKSTIWLGQTKSTEESTYRSDLGQTPDDFEIMLDKYMNGTRIADYVNRYVCYDVALRGIMSLDAAEKTLQRNYSLSLRNISDFPEIVMQVANQSVFESDFVGLRIGRMYYGKTGQVDNDVQVIGKWDNRTGMTYNSMVNIKPNATDANFDSYWIETIRPIVWRTKDGHPPKDGATLLTNWARISHDVFIAIVVLTSIMTACQLLCICRIIYLVFVKRHPLKRHFPRSKAIGLFGCVLLNCSSIAFASTTGTETLSYTYGLSVFRITLLVVSLSLIFAMLAFRVIVVYKNLELVLPPIRSGLVPSSPPDPRWNIRSSKWPTIDKSTALQSFVFLILNSIYLLMWFLVDPLQCASEKMSTTYIESEDTLVEVFVTACYSKNMLVWIFPLVVVYFIGLVLSAYLVSMMKAHVGITDACPEIAFIRLGLGNAVTLFLFSVFIVVVLHSNVINQQIAISFVALLLSASTTLFWIGPMPEISIQCDMYEP